MGTLPPTTQDIGKKLRGFYKYTEVEVEEMVMSEEYCKSVVNPVPPMMLAMVLKTRADRAKVAEQKREEEKAAKEKAPELKGTMVMGTARKVNALTRPPVQIPDTFLAMIKYRMHPSLFWFTDLRLKFATEHGADIPMKKNTSIPSAPEKSLPDVAKLKTSWGYDENTEGASVLTWLDSFKNFISAMEILCPPPDPTKPDLSTYAIELKQHAQFFRALDDFEDLFPIWYPVERDLRNKIMDGDMPFEVNYWVSETGGVLNAYKAATALANGTVRAPALKLTDLAFPGTSSAPKRRDDDSHRRSDRHWRDVAPVVRDDGNHHRDSFRPEGRDSFRPSDHNGDDRRTRDRRVVCLVCTEDHVVREHPPANRESKDRRPHLTTYEHGVLKLARPREGEERKAFCIGWNCGRSCDGSNHPVGLERAHACSLCGGDHPALPANARCRRAQHLLHFHRIQTYVLSSTVAARPTPLSLSIFLSFSSSPFISPPHTIAAEGRIPVQHTSAAEGRLSHIIYLSLYSRLSYTRL
ncbi:hypothetical protein C8F04DRAFT_1280638 [Mycena alexandri]|uniref:Uncharacterized protein n=1 Tax=Mycena alexandri TaxID=1745969 RepID=A0AAD6WKC9_9AGAR|nr:hypothetical protein C8F04DRAFT_1280638 [Mycena alexandri]